MNAVTRAESRALEIADPTRNLILVPLPQLSARRSRRNARTTPRQSIPELAASIARVGLLQNLIVILAADGESYEVVAGDRRLTALKLLAKKKRIAANFEVPCLLVADASARTVSLAENLLREQMHPADQFEAFAALVKEGRPIEDIAADFGVSPLVVQRRLKLAHVSPRLLADYRAGGVTLEQLMALTITDDHAAQEAAFYAAPEWQRSANALRERLTEREVSADHALARFVGMDVYTAAGGGIRRDLFAAGDAGTYLVDAALLDTLVHAKLDALAGDVRAEGWAWVEAVPQLAYEERQAFQTAPLHRREPSRREARRIASLHGRLEKIDAELEEAGDAEDEVRTETLEQRRDQVAGELEDAEGALLCHAPEVREVAGAIVTLGRDGEAVIHRGLLRDAEAKVLRALDRLRRRSGDAEGEACDEPEDADDAPRAARLSDRLAQRLSAHRTAALQIEVARHPHVALAALVHGMVQAVLQADAYGDGLPLGVRLTVQDRLEGLAPDWPESPAAVALRELQQVAGAALPEDATELFAALLAKSQDELVRLLAVCVAATVDVVTPRATPYQPGEELARAVGLDMAAWWKPTAEGYFRHISKPAILQAVGEYASEQINRLAKLKKTDLASEAERLAEGSGWMPAVFQARYPTEPEAASDSDAEDTTDEVGARALAA
ncbi:ParB/RepB/Spo0J family partition protein [Stenotrophomonas maltophilia]|uniref:ParB/RepB/Spo0J family partition protein n=1 Tax=Stenotrophomonas maltophilia TaxID=40324 RepID=UPI00209A8DB5|nr:ParB N-terminal domain-containing protein [Stenotrophomonas maltophilia]MCO7486988.1 ParB N-terminal domain-containing protein [Stenotrophomonas maltophilia]